MPRFALRPIAPWRFAAGLLAALAPGLAVGCGGAKAPAGEVRLPSGRAAHYAYHHDRNALAASHQAGDVLIALTRAGNLLRFDARTLKPAGEWFGPVAATCLGRGEADTVLAGLADGRICRVDPATLALEPMARVEGAVRWVGWSPGGLVAVAGPTVLREWVKDDWRPSEYSVVHDLATGKAYKLTRTTRDEDTGKEAAFDERASTFLLDARRRLWLGGDRGEWGGWCFRVDLAAGTVAEVEGIKDDPGDRRAGWDGIYGFAELPDGQVWAHGGVIHMNLSRGFVRRIDGPKVEPVYLYSNFDARRGHEDEEKPPEPGRPYLPITHILPDRDGKLLVFAYSRVYRVDPGLKDWSKIHAAGIRYHAGRPDAVGSYPSVVGVHRVDDRILLATAYDGYVAIAGGRQTIHALPGQFGLDEVRRIVATAEGALFLPRSDEGVPWRLAADGWEAVALDPDGPKPEGEDSWERTRVLVGPRGEVSVVHAADVGGGPVTTARRVDGRWEVIGRENASLEVSACFITPDGTLWNADDGILLRFANGVWDGVAAFPPDAAARKIAAGIPGEGLEVGRGLRAVEAAGPPWFLRDGDHSQLLRLDDGPGFAKPKLDAVKVAEAGARLKVHDVLPGSKGELLLATDRGLRRLDIATDAVRSADLPAPGGPVKVLARDGLGRLWLGGEGLWLVDGGELVDLGSALPMVGRTAVKALAADPAHPDGILLSLGTRGVASVWVLAKP